jgi:hypothetical protein
MSYQTLPTYISHGVEIQYEPADNLCSLAATTSHSVHANGCQMHIILARLMNRSNCGSASVSPFGLRFVLQSPTPFCN